MCVRVAKNIRKSFCFVYMAECLQGAKCEQCGLEHCVRVCGWRLVGVRVPPCMLSKHFEPSCHRGHVPRNECRLPMPVVTGHASTFSQSGHLIIKTEIAGYHLFAV